MGHGAGGTCSAEGASKYGFWREDELARVLCERQRDEHTLYVPVGLCPDADGWRAHFTRIWGRRDAWKPVSDGDSAASKMEAPIV